MRTTWLIFLCGLWLIVAIAVVFGVSASMKDAISPPIGNPYVTTNYANVPITNPEDANGYIDYPYPPLRTNASIYFWDAKYGTAYLHLCNDGQIRWSYNPKEP